MTLTELAERIGITLANLSILKTGKARAIRFSTLEAICAALRCQPGDLLEYAAPAGAEDEILHGGGRMNGIPQMPEVSLFRLYVLRAVYLFVAVGIALTIWPRLISPPPEWPLMNGVVCALLGAVSVLALLGFRHPLLMLPILLFELIWKAIWLIAVALPLWRTDALDAATMATVRDCVPALILLVAIPWRYAIARYLTRTGRALDDGRRRRAARRGQSPGTVTGDCPR